MTALAAGGLFSGVGSATLPGSSFEGGDGNLVVDAAGSVDWNSATEIDCVPPGILNCGIDKPTGQQDDSFGQGASEDSPVPTVVDGSIPNNKSDLTRFYVAAEDTAGDDFLYLAWERVQEPTGTTNMDFEFNQSTALSSNGVTPVRTAGDLLIKYDLSQGGVNPQLGYHRWLTSVSQANALGYPGTTAAAVCEATNKLPCWSKVDSLDGNFEGAVNTVNVSDTIAPDAPRSLSPRTFGEAAINLTDSGLLDPAVCTSFGRAYLKSRSSDSFTAALKDFIAPIPVDINNCQPAQINLLKQDPSGASLAGAQLELYRDVNGNGTLQIGTDELVGSCTTTVPVGTGCSFQVTLAGTYIGHEAAPPAGYTSGAPDVVQVVTITSTAQTFNLIFTNSPAAGTITVVKVDDQSPAARLNGAVFTLYRDVAPVSGTGTPPQTAPGTEDTTVDNTVGTCTTAGTGAEAGKCSFTNVALGTYWVVETTTPAGYVTAAPQAATVGLGSSSAGQTITLTFTDVRLHRVVTLVCHEGSETLHASSVTLDGTTLTSISAVPAALAAKGVTQADLCALGGASFGGKGHGTFNGSVTVGGHSVP